jgi:Uma2 family endonuclease
MTGTVTLTWNQPRVLRIDPGPQPMTEEEFFAFCQLNPEWRIERTAEGELILMPPTGGETGNRNSALTALLWIWAEADATGLTFDSSTGFTLSNGAKRSPDAAWVRRSRWETLTPEQRREFPPLCPDFVVELLSPSDDLEALKQKLEEYIANGAQLGWLLDPEERKVYIYRPSEVVVCLNDPKEVAGEPLLPGFVLDLDRVWS